MLPGNQGTGQIGGDPSLFGFRKILEFLADKSVFFSRLFYRQQIILLILSDPFLALHVLGNYKGDCQQGHVVVVVAVLGDLFQFIVVLPDLQRFVDEGGAEPFFGSDDLVDIRKEIEESLPDIVFISFQRVARSGIEADVDIEMRNDAFYFVDIADDRETADPEELFVGLDVVFPGRCIKGCKDDGISFDLTQGKDLLARSFLVVVQQQFLLLMIESDPFSVYRRDLFSVKVTQCGVDIGDDVIDAAL